MLSNSGISPVHTLLGQPNPTPADAEVLQRLLEGGADINPPDTRRQAPLAILYNNDSANDQLSRPLYDVLFARQDLDFDAPASKIITVRQLLARNPHYKPDFQQRARDYSAVRRATS